MYSMALGATGAHGQLSYFTSLDPRRLYGVKDMYIMTNGRIYIVDLKRRMKVELNVMILSVLIELRVCALSNAHAMKMIQAPRLHG